MVQKVTHYAQGSEWMFVELYCTPSQNGWHLTNWLDAKIWGCEMTLILPRDTAVKTPGSQTDIFVHHELVEITDRENCVNSKLCKEDR